MRVPSSNWSILCDFDGTIALDDVTDVLLARLGRPGWERLEDDWRAGRIGSRECMAGQIALLDGDRDELDAVIDQIDIDPDFPAFVAAVRAAGVALTIVSDGLDHAIERTLARHGLGQIPLRANRLRHVPGQGWSLQFPHAVAGCRSGHCKCACVDEQRCAGRSTLLVGDGQSDACAAGRVDFVFAKHRLLEHCRDHGLAHRPIAGFADAVALLPDLLAGRLHAPAAEPMPFPLPRVQYA